MTDTDTTTQAGAPGADAVKTVFDKLEAQVQSQGLEAKADAADAAKAAAGALDTAKSDVAGDAAKVEGAFETAKTDVAGVVSKVEGTIETDFDAVKAKALADADLVKSYFAGMTNTIVETIQAEFAKLQTTAATEKAAVQTTAGTDVQKAHAAVSAAVTHIEAANASGIVSSELEGQELDVAHPDVHRGPRLTDRLSSRLSCP